MADEEKKWLWQGRALLLTYPRCSLAKDKVLADVKSTLNEDWVLEKYICSQETHEDGDYTSTCSLFGKRDEPFATRDGST